MTSEEHDDIRGRHAAGLWLLALAASAVVGTHGLQILVSGGWGSASSQCIWLNSVHGEMVTRKIEWSWE